MTFSAKRMDQSNSDSPQNGIRFFFGIPLEPPRAGMIQTILYLGFFMSWKSFQHYASGIDRAHPCPDLLLDLACHCLYKIINRKKFGPFTGHKSRYGI